MYKYRTDQSEKEKVKEICKAHKGQFTNFADGSYQCANVLDATIDFDMGKINLKETGSPSRFKIKDAHPYNLIVTRGRLGSGSVDFKKPLARLGSGSVDFFSMPGLGSKSVHI
jgi:hypothetical protein